jgi:hypothetical protein
MVEQLTEQLCILQNKVRFLGSVMSGELDIKNVDEVALAKVMRTSGYHEMVNNDAKDDEDTTPTGLKGFRYLLGMNIRSFTKQKMDELMSETASVTAKLELVKTTPVATMWSNELDELAKSYTSY